MTRTVVLMLSVDEAELLRHSLPLAVEQPADAVYVIDNACRDDTSAFAERHGAQVIRLDRRLSYAAAMNRGLDAAAPRADAVLVLNADCFLVPGTLAHGLAALDRPNIACVAPKLLRTAGPPRDPAAPAMPHETIDTIGMTIDRRRKNGLVGHGRSALLYPRAAPVFGADWACGLYRADLLRGDEVLDEDMALWASDADFSWRVAADGWRSVYEPRFVGRHMRTYSPSTRARSAPEHRRLQFRNRLLMLAKNETAAGLRRDGARIAAYELAALGYATLREPRALLPGYVDAARLLPGALRRRRPGRERPAFGVSAPAY